MADTLTVRVVSPDHVAFEGEASAITVPAWDGRVGVLPGHAPFVTLLGQGRLIIDRPGGGSEDWWVAGGALKVDRNEVTILSEYASAEEPGDLPAGVQVSRPEDFNESTAGKLPG